jgi:predicted GIY-YIG superfamily endonuclease
MCRGYIYLISFKDTNDIYIGKTTYDIKKRFKEHKNNKKCVVNNYVQNKLNDNWDNVYIDIIDSVDINEDLTHLINHPLNINRKYTKYYKNDLAKYKLHITEQYYIKSYQKEDKYKLINKQILKYFHNYEDDYIFFQYS